MIYRNYTLAIYCHGPCFELNLWLLLSTCVQPRTEQLATVIDRFQQASINSLFYVGVSVTMKFNLYIMLQNCTFDWPGA